jgi:predicted DNA-binding transcriptional regulator AlpA
MSFEKSGGEVAKACAAVGISRKTFYLWLEKDATFRTLVDIKAGDD